MRLGISGHSALPAGLFGAPNIDVMVTSPTVEPPTVERRTRAPPTAQPPNGAVRCWPPPRGGHLALSQGALPLVVPVTCALDGEDLLVRAGLG